MSLITLRFWGFRLLDVIGLGLLIALILSVYLAKTIAGRERTEIASVERQIVEEQQRIRLLQAEVAHLERPDRLERLSVSYLNLAPIQAARETTPEDLPRELVIVPTKGPAL
jgi:cell division protein FtsL